MKTLTLTKTPIHYLTPEDQSQIQHIARIIYSDHYQGINKWTRSWKRRIDGFLNFCSKIVQNNPNNTVFWLSDHYDSRIPFSLNNRIYRATTLTELIKNSFYLKEVSIIKPKYLILKLSGSDFLSPGRIKFIIEEINQTKYSNSDVFDILKLILKKSLQKMYFSVQMLSPDTTIICQELYYPPKWSDQLAELGITNKDDQNKMMEQLSCSYCNVIKELTHKYENFQYEGCKGN